MKIYVHSRGGLLKDRTIKISSHQSTGNFYNYNAGTNNDNICTDLTIICIFNSGIDYFKLTSGTPAEIQFDIDVIVTYLLYEFSCFEKSPDFPSRFQKLLEKT